MMRFNPKTEDYIQHKEKSRYDKIRIWIYIALNINYKVPQPLFHISLIIS